MKAELRWVTPDAEFNMAYCARVSSIKNQDSKEFEKLFRYCLKNNHWSVFQMSSMCLHIETSLAVSVQFMRHWSLQIHEPLDVQMLSQRYTDPLNHGLGFQEIQLRSAGATNRQSSTDLLTDEKSEKANKLVENLLAEIEYTHSELNRLGVANECSRMILPQATTTRFFVSGSCRSFIHYLQMRDDPHAQLEHQLLAKEIKKIFSYVFPTIYEILFPQE